MKKNLFFAAILGMALVVVMNGCGGGSNSKSVKSSGAYMELTDTDGSTFLVSKKMYQAEEKELLLVADYFNKRKVMPANDVAFYAAFALAWTNDLQRDDATEKLFEKFTSEDVAAYVKQITTLIGLIAAEKPLVLQETKDLENLDSKVLSFANTSASVLISKWFPSVKFKLEPNLGNNITAAEDKLTEIANHPPKPQFIDEYLKSGPKEFSASEFSVSWAIKEVIEIQPEFLTKGQQDAIDKIETQYAELVAAEKAVKDDVQRLENALGCIVEFIDIWDPGHYSKEVLPSGWNSYWITGEQLEAEMQRASSDDQTRYEEERSTVLGKLNSVDTGDLNKTIAIIIEDYELNKQESWLGKRLKWMEANRRTDGGGGTVGPERFLELCKMQGVSFIFSE